MAKCVNLNCKFDSRKSFYGKALVTYEDNGDILLTSYTSKVCLIHDGQATLGNDWDYSNTTVRHVKEFLKQNGFKADSTSFIRDNYKEVTL